MIGDLHRRRAVFRDHRILRIARHRQCVVLHIRRIRQFFHGIGAGRKIVDHQHPVGEIAVMIGLVYAIRPGDLELCLLRRLDSTLCRLGNLQRAFIP